jgi:hypothetical protein
VHRDPVAVGGGGAIAVGDGLRFPPVVGMPSGGDGLILVASRLIGSRDPVVCEPRLCLPFPTSLSS